MSRQYTDLPQPPPRPIPANRNEPENSIWSANGRIGRKDFILYTLITCICLYTVALIGINHINLIKYISPSSIIIFELLIILYSILYGIIFTIKRLHDMGYSGYWVFFIYFINCIIPDFYIVSILTPILLCCIPGTKGKNRYGDVP